MIYVEVQRSHIEMRPHFEFTHPALKLVIHKTELDAISYVFHHINHTTAESHQVFFAQHGVWLSQELHMDPKDEGKLFLKIFLGRNQKLRASWTPS